MWLEQWYGCFMLQQWFSDGRASESLGETGQLQIYGSHSDPEIPDLEHRGWGLRICISECLTGSQVMLMLQVQGPHLENHCMTAFCSEYGGGGAGNGRRGGGGSELEYPGGARGQWTGNLCKQRLSFSYSKVTSPFLVQLFRCSYSKKCEQHIVLLIDKSSGQG